MTKRERIAALEKRLDALEREVASLPRWHWTYPQPGWIEKHPPLRVGDGMGDVQPFGSPTVTWSNTTGVKQ